MTGPAIAFTAEHLPEPYASPDRPSLWHFITPCAASEPWICDLPELKPFLRSSACPSTLEEYLLPNTPLIHIHVSIFDDLTFLGVTSTHITFDALGIGALLQAWTRLLSGDALEDIPGMPVEITPFASFDVNNRLPIKVAPIRGWFELGFLSKLVFTMKFMLGVRRDSKELVKVMRLPKVFLERKKQAITKELQADGSSEWVGSSDILMAWWLKTTYSYRAGSTTPLHVQFAINLRKLPIFPSAPSSGLLEPLCTPFINNAFSSISLPPLSISDLCTSSLRDLALRIRRTITAYTTDPAGIVADLRWRCANPFGVLFPSPPGAEYAMQTSWRAACFGELDFTGAIHMPNSEANERREQQKARVVFVVPPIVTSNIYVYRPVRGSAVVLMEDEEGIWMSQVKGSKDWEAVKRAGGIEFI